MKWFLICIMSFLTMQVYSQETYSKVIDVDTNASRNYIRDMVLVEDEILTQSIQFCSQDTISFVCGSITLFDKNGEIVKSNYNYLTAAFYDGPNCLGYSLDNIYYSTNLLEDRYQYTSLFSYDLELKEQTSMSFSGPLSNSNINNQGLVIIDGYIYLYGIVHNASGVPDSTQIIKTDMDGNEMDRFYYSYGNSRLEINNFQATPDGNFAFILELQSPAGPNNGFNGYQLMKIDTAGNVLDSFVFEEIPTQPNRLLTTSDGGYVFSSNDHPITGADIFTTGYGLINKMDADMDTLEWSLILPNDQLVDGRDYRVWDYIETANGDIVACGTARDNTDTELDTGIPDKNSTWNGFIVRVSPDGEIIWLRLYKINNDLLPHDEYGRFRPSRLNKIKELPDGRFVAAGDVFVTTSQFFAIDELETEGFHLWLLMVDEEGCLDGYDCEEIIRMNQKTNYSFSLGDQWTYEEVDYLGAGNGIVGYKTYAIQDTVVDENQIKYAIRPNDTFFVENSQMYFWDDYFEEYIMYFDFQETESYEIKYYDPFRDSEEIATVVIDSISFMPFGDDSLQVQHVHILNSGSLEDYSEVVYEGVGAGYFGIKFLLGCGLCDFNPYTTHLRCFSNASMTYQFVPHPCDSTWLLTSTDEIESEAIRVYPNPTVDRVTVEGIDADIPYELQSVAGQLLQSGITEGKSIHIKNTGLNILKLQVGNKWIIRKIVKLE